MEEKKSERQKRWIQCNIKQHVSGSVAGTSKLLWCVCVCVCVSVCHGVITASECWFPPKGQCGQLSGVVCQGHRLTWGLLSVGVSLQVFACVWLEQRMANKWTCGTSSQKYKDPWRDLCLCACVCERERARPPISFWFLIFCALPTAPAAYCRRWRDANNNMSCVHLIGSVLSSPSCLFCHVAECSSAASEESAQTQQPWGTFCLLLYFQD